MRWFFQIISPDTSLKMIEDFPLANENADPKITVLVLPDPVGPKRAQFVCDIFLVNAFEPVTAKPKLALDKSSQLLPKVAL